MLDHAYVEFENTAVWTVVKKAINELERNKDLKLTTPDEYIIGYICKQLVNNNILESSATKKHSL